MSIDKWHHHVNGGRLCEEVGRGKGWHLVNILVIYQVHEVVES